MSANIQFSSDYLLDFVLLTDWYHKSGSSRLKKLLFEIDGTLEKVRERPEIFR